MPPAVVQMAEAALIATIAEMQPAREEVLVARVTRHAGIIGQDWGPSGKAEFIAMIVSELSEFPAEIVLDALDRARRKVTVGRMLLVWVCDDVAPRVAKLEVEYRRLLRLVEIAATPA